MYSHLDRDLKPEMVSVESLFGLGKTPHLIWNVGWEFRDCIEYRDNRLEECDGYVCPQWDVWDQAKFEELITLVLDDASETSIKEIQLLNYSYGQMMKLIIEHYRTLANVHRPQWIEDYVWFKGLQFSPDRTKIECHFSSTRFDPNHTYPYRYSIYASTDAGTD